ncbi:MAG: penicillin acylase family protein [Thermodesulfobacteriota bacterium]|nr:penicillin acylase family protein [Thermodesulfobacteriota bacterium]
MRLRNKEIHLNGHDGDIHLKRNIHGIPEIMAQTPQDLAYGLGWVHANDRQLQTLLTRIILRGEASWHLGEDESLLELDKYMKRMNFLPDAESETKKLDKGVLGQVAAYAEGFNDFLLNNSLVYELRFLGYDPEPWDIGDTLILGKVFGFLGLAEAQGGMERFLLQMIQKGIDEDRIRELFPLLCDEIAVSLLKKIRLSPSLVPNALRWLPVFNASNNWAVSGRLTRSGKPIMCGDPHLEVNRLPNIWQESVMRLPDNTLKGVTVPGCPGILLGRTDYISWSATYSFMDMLDFRIEHCRQGQYERSDGWKEFQVRDELIRVKKADPVHLRILENEHGVLEGDPEKEGYYLVNSWSAARGCGADDFNGMLNLHKARNVRDAMGMFKRLDAASFNYVITDIEGNIGYQMSGRLFNRPRGVSGLLPVPAWDPKYDNDGFVDKDLLPSQYNPEDGIIATSNQDLNYLGEADPINLCMGGYRAGRVRQLLQTQTKLGIEDMKNIHFDLYSLQAQRFMEIILPLLPDTPNADCLRQWDLQYRADSRGAMLFESVYHALINVVFGDNALGRDVCDYIFRETSLFNDYYINLDEILTKDASAWFAGHSRSDLFKKAIDEGLDVQAVAYGKTRRIMFKHLLFGDKLPSFLGFDYGPVELMGCRATVPQGQIFKNAGRTTTFSPSYRFIADMNDNKLHTTLAGGPSDRRFSSLYLCDIKNWFKGIYKVLE